MNVDPLAALVAGGADLAALIDGELAQLAADAQALGALLVEGVVVNARVLPSNGLTDLLEIAGRRVAASLPPTVRPGDVLQVRVTGFDGGRILLQIVATGADAAVEPGPPNLPLAPDPAAFVAASIRPAGSTAAPPATAAPAGTPASSALPAQPARGAPSAADLASGTVPPADELPPLAVPPTRPGLTPGFASAVSRANVAPAAPTDPAPVRGAVVPTGEPSSIEARVAAAQAASGPPGARAVAPPGSRAAAPLEPAPAVAAQRFVAPPRIEAKSAIPPPAVPTPAAAGPAAARATGLAAYAQPVALLRALKLPVTPSSVSSAALALQRPERLPAALAALEAALPPGGDAAHVATLRTLLAFVGRIDPRSPVLAAQIAAYVEHVVDGPEPKLATLLAAARAAAPSASAAPAAQAPATALAPHTAPAFAAAVAAERGAALNANLKQTLLAVAADPATPAALVPSLAGALTALTAVQVNAAQALAAQPDGIAFTIPLTTPSGTANAHISVKRDAPQGGGARLNAENFRIAFVLDTAHYGTVAIDLVTVGREVTIDVRTDAAPALRAFRDALGALTARLESLRYRVASAGASLGPTSMVAVDAPPSRPPDADATVDRSA